MGKELLNLVRVPVVTLFVMAAISKMPLCNSLPRKILSRAGLEPATRRLRVFCSTN